ncbi:MAG: DmsE family decaheme c-type cytochrome [Nitrospirae bacterium]|nr:DmsE family decaheme c-type cytochrome [Nitrospirota bacterium]
MNRKKIFASLLVIVLILIIFAQNILLTEVPSSPAEGAVSIPPVEAVMPAPPAEVTTPLPPAEATIPLPAAEATIPLPPAEATIPLPPIDVTLPILPEKETFFTPLPTERKRENVGMDKCIKCHKDQSARWEGTIHAKWSPSFTTPEKAKGVKIECETCHGPGSLHVEDNKERLFIISFGPGSKDTKAEQNTVCLKCHEKGGLYYWNGGVHGRNLRCADCHHVMDNISRRYLLNKTSEKEICFQCHVRQKSEGFRSPHLSHDEAKMTCSTCHTPHGSSTQGLLSASSVNENCYNCHADKRGPYLFEHLPVQENCLLCHKPHSSIHRPLLKVRQPFLCLECHSNLPVKSTGMPDPHNVMDPRSRYVYNRGCTNCHPMIHGSKHPSGARLQR